MPTQSERLETAIDTLEGLVANRTGTGDMVLKTGPTLVNPILGAATATTINGLTFTTGTGTLTLGTFTLSVAANASVAGTNTGDQTITLTGDVTGTGTGTFAATIGVGKVTDAMSAMSNKPTVMVVATTNVTLSGEQTIDGEFTTASLVLLTAQSTGSQNGPWVTAAGSWSRPAWYATGSTAHAVRFLTIQVRRGTLGAGSVWTMDTASVTVDTTATTWERLGNAQITNNGVGLQNSGRKYKIISGFLSHTTGVGWSILNDASHEPMGVDVGTSLTLHDFTEPNGRTLKAVRVTFTANTGLTGAKVVSCTVGSYEDLENGIRPLPNIGTTNVTFHMHQHRTWRTRVYYDGSAWQRDTNGDCSSVTTSTFSADGIFPVYRQKSLVTNQYGYAISNKPGVAWHRDTTYPWVRNVDQFKPYNTTTGAVITAAATTLDCEIVRHACGYVDANDTANFPGVLLPFTVILSFD